MEKGLLGFLSAITAILFDRLGILPYIMLVLIGVMVIDYITGLMAAKWEELEYNDGKHGWSSRRGLQGILKKVSFIFIIMVGLCMDYLIGRMCVILDLQFKWQSYFALLLTVWFILNEALSILENVGRMGVQLPKWLENTITEIKGRIDSMEDNK